LLIYKNMHIAIDANEANTKEKVGVSNYAFEILWGFYRLNNLKSNPNTFSIFLKSNPNDDLPKENIFWKYKVVKGNKFWVLKKLTLQLYKRPRPDVFFTPSHYLPLSLKIPKIFTLHDLGYLKFSDHFKKYDYWQLKYWTAISIYVSKYIIAVSYSTKNDIVRQYPFALKKIRVIYHGFDNRRFNTKINNNFVRQILKKYNIDENYILFIGTLKPSKNIEGLIEGFYLIKDRFPEYKLVIAGKKGWLYDSIYNKVREKKLENRVIFTDYISEEDKPAIIKGARVFVLPSFWEGFGMDVLSSFACGTPVVLSKLASLPEVGGSAGIYVDPFSPISISEGISKVLLMNKLEYNNLVEKGFKQIKKFSWDKTAIKTISLIENAV